MSQETFEDFWAGLDRDLSAVPLELSLEEDDFYSKPEWTVYRMGYNTTDGHRLFAWLSVPVRSVGENFPAIVRMPDYASVHDIIYTPLRKDAVVMNPSYRGQRNSDKIFQANYPGLLTESIDRPEDYIMRRVFGDALRALDALLGLSEFNVGTVALTGSGLGGALALAASSRRPSIAAVAADTPLILGHPATANEISVYPLAELTDYRRVHPDRAQAVAASTAPLDPIKIAPAVRVPVLMSLGQRDRGQCPIEIGEELARLIPECDLRVYDGASEGGGHEHGQIRSAWIAERLGIS